MRLESRRVTDPMGSSKNRTRDDVVNGEHDDNIIVTESDRKKKTVFRYRVKRVQTFARVKLKV